MLKRVQAASRDNDLNPPRHRLSRQSAVYRLPGTSARTQCQPTRTTGTASTPHAGSWLSQSCPHACQGTRPIADNSSKEETNKDQPYFALQPQTMTMSKVPSLLPAGATLPLSPQPETDLCTTIQVSILVSSIRAQENLQETPNSSVVEL